MRIVRTLLLAMLIVVGQSLNAQQVVWTTEVDSCASASSPRLTDLNGDGILDVVIGDGIFDDINDLGHVNALNGIDGSVIWRKTVGFDKFNSALFYDFNGDETDDIVISGRFPELLAIDGTDGSTIWAFDNSSFVPPTGWKHFYNQQLLPDLTNDQIPEILASNGGEQDSLPGSISRPPGFLLIIDGSDGSLVSYAVVPDSAEVYCAPVLYDIDNDQQLEIIFGTGGETHAGSLWIAELSDLLNGNIDNAINIAENQTKGFLGSPALADMNNDGRLDIIGSSYEGYLTVIDGVGLNEIWRFNMPGGETYVTPAIGYFNSDEYLDLFMGFGIGSFPFYTMHRQFLLDGQNGNVLFEDSLGFNGMSSPVAIDMDDDGFDEVFYLLNIANPLNPFDFSSATSVVRYYDFNDGQFTNISSPNPGISWGSTPHIKDVDGDGQVELFYAYSKDAGPSFADKTLNVVRINLTGSPDLEAPWAAYQGSLYTSVYPTSIPTDLHEISNGNYDCIEIAFRSNSIDFELLLTCEMSQIQEVEFLDLLGRNLTTFKINSREELSTQLNKFNNQPVLARFIFSNGTSKSRLMAMPVN